MAYSYEQFLIELGSRLRKLRIERGWTLRHMIVTHGFHLAHWQGFEKGKGMSIPSLLRVCDVFGLRLEDLVSGAGWSDSSLPAEDQKDAGTRKSMAAPAKKVASKKTPAKSLASPVESPPRDPRRKL